MNLISRPTPLNYEAAAALLGITEGQLRLLVMRKAIPHYRIGPRTVRFDPERLRTWLEERRVG